MKRLVGESSQHRVIASMNRFWWWCLMFVLIGCRKADFAPCSDHTSLQHAFDFPIGVAYEPAYALSDSSYRVISHYHFDQWTPENVMKWGAISFQPETYQWTEADAFVSTALQAGKKLHGHTLIWYRQEPDWLPFYQADARGWEQLLRSHIRTVMGRYRGMFRAWDVVNEAFLADGRLRPCIWLDKLGPEYLFIAYEEAAKTDPQALLFYNDFGMEDNPAKLRAVLRWVDQLRARGIRIDGIGLQMHIQLYYPDAARMGKTFFDIADHQLLLHLSELDIAVGDQLAKGNGSLSELWQKQANRYQTVVSMYSSLPRKSQYGITLWGVSDRYSWLRTADQPQESPLLWDDEYQPKPAFCALISN